MEVSGETASTAPGEDRLEELQLELKNMTVEGEDGKYK